MYSDEEFPIQNVNPSKIGRTFRVVESDSSKYESESKSRCEKASVSRKPINKKPVTNTRQPQNHKQPRKPSLKNVNFVRGPSSVEEKASFENTSNVDFVQEQKARMSNSQTSTSKAP